MAVRFRRSWVPNLVTSGNLFCGFLAVIAAVDGNSLQAAILICLAASFDTLDGRTARALGVSGEFGKELDSLADVVSFGVAPALLIYQISLHQVPFIGVTAAGIFVCCGAGRLARYNLISSSDKRFFVGMPIPMAGMTAASLAVYTGSLNPFIATFIVSMTGLLMISTLRFPAMDQLAFNAPIPIRIMFTIIFVLSLSRPGQFLFVLPLVYITYGLLANLFWTLKARPKTA
jgi:CDP-diacylglycerol--serine O-phosphatidyltransferase